MSITDPIHLWPTLGYADAPAAITFLTDVLGFTEVIRYPAGAAGDLIAHAQLRWPAGGGVMLRSQAAASPAFADRPRGAASIYLVTDQPDAVWERCRAADAGVVQGLREEDFGSRGFSIADSEGNVWSVGTYAGVDPAPRERTAGAPAITLPPLEAAIELPVSRDDAFATFTAGFDSWWPREFTWSQADNLQGMVFGDRPDALLSEIGPYGFRIDWGRITRWDPPQAVAFTWQIAPDRTPVPDPSRASEVVVDFTAVEDGCTRVTLTHGGWERHDGDATAYREDFAQAWPMALQALRTHLTSRR